MQIDYQFSVAFSSADHARFPQEYSSSDCHDPPTRLGVWIDHTIVVAAKIDIKSPNAMPLAADVVRDAMCAADLAPLKVG